MTRRLTEATTDDGVQSGASNQTIPVKHFNTHNIYQYNHRNLIISYSIAIGLTLISIAFGAIATASNGVSHSTSFSAMVATTRNPQLDQLVQGSSLGSLPLDQDMSRTKLKFRELIGDGGQRSGHIAFGFESKVLDLKTNGVTNGVYT